MQVTSTLPWILLQTREDFCLIKARPS